MRDTPEVGASNTLVAQLANFINAADYGARGDNTSDNTTALQTAFEVGKSSGYGIWIPAGTYNHAGPIVLNGVAVAGTGNSTILAATNQTDSAILLTGNNVSLTQVATTVNASQRSSQPLDAAVLVQNAINATVSHVSVQGASSNGIRLDNAANCIISDNFVNGTNADGIALMNGSQSNLVQRCQVMNASDDSFSSNSYIGDAKQDSGNSFENCYAGPNHLQGRGFVFMGSANENIRDCVSVGSLWHGMVAGTDTDSATMDGGGNNFQNNLIMGNASSLPIMLTRDNGMTAAKDQNDIAVVTGTMTSGDANTVLGWEIRTIVADPLTFSSYAGGGPGSNNANGVRT